MLSLYKCQHTRYTSIAFWRRFLLFPVTKNPTPPPHPLCGCMPSVDCLSVIMYSGINPHIYHSHSVNLNRERTSSCYWSTELHHSELQPPKCATRGVIGLPSWIRAKPHLWIFYELPPFGTRAQQSTPNSLSLSSRCIWCLCLQTFIGISSANPFRIPPYI